MNMHNIDRCQLFLAGASATASAAASVVLTATPVAAGAAKSVGQVTGI